MLAELILAAGLAGRGDAATELAVHIVRNHFVDAKGKALRLVGVNRSGSEFTCMANRDFFDRPSDAESIQQMAAWHINTVRVPLNEDCWLDINGAPSDFSGLRYREAILTYVQRLHAAGLYVVLDLHWNEQAAYPPMGELARAARWRTVTTHRPSGVPSPPPSATIPPSFLISSTSHTTSAGTAGGTGARRSTAPGRGRPQACRCCSTWCDRPAPRPRPRRRGRMGGRPA